MRPNDYFYFLTSLVPDIWQANLEIKIAALETQIEETKAKLDDAAAKLKCVSDPVFFTFLSAS